MQITAEDAYNEATQAIGEAAVRERFLHKQINELARQEPFQVVFTWSGPGGEKRDINKPDKVWLRASDGKPHPTLTVEHYEVTPTETGISTSYWVVPITQATPPEQA